MANYYVDNSGPDGDGSFGNPWNNIAGHVDDLSPGDVMYLRGNVAPPGQIYAEDVVVSAAVGCVDGTAANPITITTYNSEYVILRSAGSGWRRTLDIDGLDYWIVDGIDSNHRIVFDKQDYSGYAVDIRQAANCKIRYCELKDCSGMLIHIHSSGYITIEYNTIHDAYVGPGTDAHGISFDDSSHCLIRYNTFYDCYGDGLQAYDFPGAMTDNTIEFNEFYCTAPAADGCEEGLDIKAGTGWVIRNNTFHGFNKYADGSNGASGQSPYAGAIMLHSAPDGVEIYNNVFYDCNSGIVSYAANLVIRHNLFHTFTPDPAADASTAIFLHACSDTMIHNNTIVDASDYSLIFSSSVTDAEIKNNLFVDCNQIDMEVGATYTADYNGWYDCVDTLVGANDTTGTAPQPWFVGGGDYHLQAASTAIDAGVDLGYSYLGDAPDLGLYEFMDTEPTPVPPPNTARPYLVRRVVHLSGGFVN